MESDTSNFELVDTQPSVLSWITRLSRTRASTTDSIALSSSSSLRLQGIDDVLKTIQKLRLPKYSDGEVERVETVGQGETYLVERCIVGKQVLAIKTLKLSDVSKDRTKFLRRLNSVLLELRIMHHEPFRTHPNILNLVAYGWSNQESRVLPYILVEYGSFGTFRDYLREGDVALRAKEILLGDVALGTAALHRACIVHGDLKLENVLVFPSWDRPSGAVAKIADFGHSLLLLGTDERQLTPRYDGTPLYNAPEVSTQHINQVASTQLYKCDVWAFGLLAWETLLNGDRYIKYITPGREAGEAAKNPPNGGEFSSILQLAKNAVPPTPGTHRAALFRGLFNLTLRTEPDCRTADLSALPIVSQWNNGGSRKLEADLALRSGTSDWSFEMFHPESGNEILWRVKEQIFHDFERCYKEAKTQTEQAAESAWELALCYLLEFGTTQNLHLAADFARKAHSSNHPLGPLIPVVYLGDEAGWTSQSYNADIVQAFQNTLALDWNTTITLEAASAISNRTRFPDYGTFSSCLSSNWKQHQPLSATIWIDDDLQKPLYVWEALILFRDLKLLTDVAADFTIAKQNIADVVGCVTDARRHTFLPCTPPTGIAKATKTLQKRSDRLYMRCADGTNAFHWLFIMGDSVQTFAHEALAPYRGALALDAPSHTVNILHKQWPLQLIGTPLAHAIATGSRMAVSALLELGATPSALIYRTGQFDTHDHRSHWNSLHLAIKYHASDILEALLEKLSFEFPISPVPYACALSFSSPVERRAMHGKEEQMNLTKTVRIIRDTENALRRRTDFPPVEELRRQTSRGVSPLTQAIDFNDLAVVSALLDAVPLLAGLAIQDPRSSRTFTYPIHFAAQLACRRNIPSSISIMKVLNKRCKGSLDEVDSDRRSPLHLAVTGPYDCASYYILQEAPHLLESRDSRGKTPLLTSRSATNSEFLLLKGANIRTVDNEGRSALHWACLSKSLELVQMLLRHHADVQCYSTLWGLPLHCAVLKKNRELTLALLQGGAIANACNADGDTPLHLAVRCSRTDLVKLLMESRADATVANRFGETPLYYAIESSDYAIVEVLARYVEAGSIVKLGMRETALHLCTRMGNTQMLAAFLQKPATAISLPNSAGYSPFQLAAMYAQVEAGKLLLDTGVADVHEKDQSGNTAYHLVLLGPPSNIKSSVAQQQSFLNLLRSKDVSLNQENASCLLPWDIALRSYKAARSYDNITASSFVLVFILEFGGRQACRMAEGLKNNDFKYLIETAIATKNGPLCAALIRSRAILRPQLEDAVWLYWSSDPARRILESANEDKTVAFTEEFIDTLTSYALMDAYARSPIKWFLDTSSYLETRLDNFGMSEEQVVTDEDSELFVPPSGWYHEHEVRNLILGPFTSSWN
ncbi:MAG: hypothetical protein M1822_004663 [Bathelium mastoideum]|nr:MAG: hypothetical protein M1822_004663 [Bathelium mastoideum]